jgi:hypothetical protein
MADEFSFPARPADLEDARAGLPVACGDLVDVGEMEDAEADDFCERERNWRGWAAMCARAAGAPSPDAAGAASRA